ncbi:50S ribosomal protein L32 [Candidatus Uhrbacteria bacterium]|nr:50S ribosomal protein L32 [Candidatus Uhrbacteria bacterium]MBT7717058.1 50S ribosomal protein L32 [Candidatus Uhrbacteria bacterium]
MSVPKKRKSSSSVRRRRSHHALSATNVQTCPNCKAPALSHITCKECGQYNGRQVVGGMEKVEKTLEKKVAKKPAKPAASKEEKK